MKPYVDRAKPRVASLAIALGLAAGMLCSAPASAAAVQSRSQQQAPIESVIAVINNEPITQRDLEVMARTLMKENPARQIRTIVDQQELMQDSMTRLMIDKLLVQVADKSDLQLDDSVEERIRLERQKAGSEANFQRLLNEQQITLDELETSFERQARREQYVASYLFGDRRSGQARPSVDINVSPAEMIEYYRGHPEEFRITAAVKVRQIYLSNSKRGGADKVAALIADIRERVAQGENFAEIAAELDDLRSRENGDLGWIDLEADAEESDYPESVIEFARKAPVGALDDPTRTETGTYINWIEERREGRVVPFREAQREVRSKVLDEKYALYQFQMLRRLMQRAVIYPEELARSMQGE